MRRNTDRSFAGKGMIALGAAGIILAIAPFRSPAFAQAQSPDAVPCRILEAMTSEQHGVVIVIFHQRDAGDGPRLGALLRRHSGASVVFQTADGQRHAATVRRLKSCFGRGLLIFKAGTAKLSAQDEILVRFPATPGPTSGNQVNEQR